MVQQHHHHAPLRLPASPVAPPPRRHGGWPCFAGGGAWVFGARTTLILGPSLTRGEGWLWRRTGRVKCLVSREHGSGRGPHPWQNKHRPVRRVRRVTTGSEPWLRASSSIPAVALSLPQR